MLTREQKKEYIDLGSKMAQKSKAIIFADFSGVGVGDLHQLKSELKKLGASFKVIKKRLLKLALQDAGIDVDPTQFDAQVGTVFVDGELVSVAGPVYAFSKKLAKEKKGFKVLGAYDAVEKSVLDADQFVIIANLPSREVLLAQVIGMVTGSLRGFMYIIDQLSKKTSEAEAPAPGLTEEAKDPVVAEKATPDDSGASAKTQSASPSVDGVAENPKSEKPKEDAGGQSDSTTASADGEGSQEEKTVESNS
ncbi:MAG: 50S ribosomal protein L10 [bacterium]|nr:50S ribosomal protein L10 [bacterium]